MWAALGGSPSIGLSSVGGLDGMTSPLVGLRTRPLTYAGLFLVTLSTLMYEIVLTRIFSVTMWYHFAFVAISVALFGMTAGALIVHLRPERFPDDEVKRQLWPFALALRRLDRGLLRRAAGAAVPHRGERRGDGLGGADLRA